MMKGYDRRRQRSAAAKNKGLPLPSPRSVALILGGLILAGFAALLALSGVTRQGAPDIALRFIPFDGFASAAKADAVLRQSKQPQPVRIAALARDSLVSQPLNARALRLLAVAEGLRGQEARVDKLIDLSQSHSRRDLYTQLLLVERAIRLGDAKTVLKHYDIALRTHSSVPELLYPRLALAMNIPELRREMRTYIGLERPWVSEFVEYSVNHSAGLPFLADMIIESRGLRGTARDKSLQRQLVDGLVRGGQYEKARQLYLQLPDRKGSRLVDATFRSADLKQSDGQMGWFLLDDAEVGGQFLENPARKPTLTVFANAGVTRAAAQKLLFLTPGTYRASAPVAMRVRSANGGLRWQMRCVTPGAEKPFWLQRGGMRSIDETITVPSSCRVQLLELIASGGDNPEGMEANVAAFVLKRR